MEFTAYYDLLKDFAGPVATIIASTVAAGITFHFGRTQARLACQQSAISRQQAQTAQQQADLATVRLQHDLFDRRYEIYEVVFSFLIEILQSNNMSWEGLNKFVRGTQKSVFVFDQETTDYFEELRKQVIELMKLTEFLGNQNNLPGPERSEAAKGRAELFNWFTVQFESLVKRLKPFLALDKNTAIRAHRPT